MSITITGELNETSKEPSINNNNIIYDLYWRG
jgi:hypothetical protein